jgi:signal transduction histidine kinase
MVDDLFDLSRIQAGSFARDLDPLPLGDLVSDCLAALQPLAAAQGVRLAGQMAAPVLVYGNGPELNRALTNLVANAIRHTRTDGRVDVLVGITERDGRQRAQVVVHDECGGIAPDDLPRLFDVGFRGEPARTPHAVNPAGAGLGLAISRGIVEAHSGSVQVENEAGGCRFTVQLPIA